MAFLAGSKRPYSAMDGSPAPLVDRSQRESPFKLASPAFFMVPQHMTEGLDNGVYGLRSNSSSPVPTPSHPNPFQSRSFDPDASVVLIGFRGTGKSTLGIILSITLQRRLIDTDHSFQEATGMSSAAFKKRFGPVEHHERQGEVLRSVLTSNSRGCIIVCGTSSLDRPGQALMREYGKTHPVINVVREMRSIQSHLKGWEENKVAELFALSSSMFRNCSNLEYFNLSESNGNLATASDGLPVGQKSPSHFLALKKAERHFVKFVSLATAKRSRVKSLESAYPLSQVRTVERTYTYAVSVPLAAMRSSSLDIEEIETGADAVELIVDSQAGAYRSSQMDDISLSLARIRRSTIIPIIYHVNFDERASLSNLSKPVNLSSATTPIPSGYLDLVLHGLRLVPEFATVDLSLNDADITRVLDVKGCIKMIGHFSTADPDAPGWEDDLWSTLYVKAQRLGLDVVRFTRPASSMEDNRAVARLRYKIASLSGKPLPLIAYSTARIGRSSVCFNPTLSSVTHKDLEKFADSTRSPLITAHQATQALYAGFVFEPMRMNIIGKTTDYSLSPAMHNAAFRACGMPHTYSIQQLSSLKELHAIVEDHSYGGSSVVLPYKVEVIALTHSLSRHARAIGAINTLIPVRHLRSDGSIPDDLSLFEERNRTGPVKALFGENTDWIGLRACVRRGLSPANAVGPKTSALVIGAGGMARSAVYALLQLGVQNLVIHNRTLENSKKLVTHFQRILSSADGINTPSSVSPLSSIESASVSFEVLETVGDAWPSKFRQPTIVVSCIPTHSIGNNPSPNFTMPPHWMKSLTGGVILEVAYKSLNTPLLNQVRAEAHRGWVAMDGLDLLPEQGFAQFELFTGRRAPRRLMRLEVLRNYKDETGQTDSKLISSRIEHIDEHDP
ncbi:shikimate dehydrogenase substrate binding domain-containing protein [Aulographum hederae CBS 113979]|uniref:Shikimate dehydrogenase substrate binding domain-containing protein n=1 Tax=Aulographum hederae CBS 113979 TaxID=1176131 RepID=A0A6G1H284_9PEZI|nr:shikimate dehydrogenase substrate binding domain-containing protein [Aulographum hederae CBS 113979]